MGEQDLTQLAVRVLCDDSPVCDEVDGNFATEADTMIDIVRVYEDDLDVIRIPEVSSTTRVLAGARCSGTYLYL